MRTWEPLVVYRWEDGSVIELSPHGSWSDARQQNIIAWRFTLRRNGKVCAEFGLSSSEKENSLYPFTLIGLLVEEAIKTCSGLLRGFFLDLFPDWDKIFLFDTYNRGPALFARPNVVAADLWDRRYDIARSKHVGNHRSQVSGEPFLGVVHGGFWIYPVARAVHEPTKHLWCGKVGSGESLVATMKSFEQIVDAVVEDYHIVADRDLQAWEAKNLVRGQWVQTSAEEIELYRMLGEPMPFFWQTEQLLEWYLERAP